MLNQSRNSPIRLRNVHRVRRTLSDGRYNYHYYYRPTRTKLPGQPGSPEFMAVYLECERIGIGSNNPQAQNSTERPVGDGTTTQNGVVL